MSDTQERCPQCRKTITRGLCKCNYARANATPTTDDQLQPVDGTEAGDRLRTPAPMARQLDAVIHSLELLHREAKCMVNAWRPDYARDNIHYWNGFANGIEAAIERVSQVKANQVEGEARET